MGALCAAVWFPFIPEGVRLMEGEGVWIMEVRVLVPSIVYHDGVEVLTETISMVVGRSKGKAAVRTGRMRAF